MAFSEIELDGELAQGKEDRRESRPDSHIPPTNMGIWKHFKD